MLSWTEQEAAIADAVASTLAFGSAPTYNGTQIEAVVMQKVDSWLQANGSEIREYRYEALIPIAELAAAPAEDDLIIDGSARYRVASAEQDDLFWALILTKEDA
jgi:hypothetical protein